MGHNDTSKQRINATTNLLRRLVRAAEQALRPWTIAVWRKFKLMVIAASRRAWLWGIGHKAAVLAGVLLLYIIFRPTERPNVSTVEPAVHAASFSSTLDSSATPTTKPVESASVAGVVLYDAKRQGADPEWGLPASLDNDQVRNLAANLKKLDIDARRHFERAELLSQEYIALSNNQVRQLLFDRIADKGFKDREIPILWRSVSKYYGVNGIANLLVDGVTAGEAHSIFVFRLDSAMNDVVDGSPTIGDTLFVATFRRFIDNGDKQLDQEMPEAATFCGRLVAEFPELTLTYYDSDGTKHDHIGNPQPLSPTSPAEFAEVRDLIDGCSKKGQVYDSIIAGNDKRRSAIYAQLDSVMQLNNQNLRAAWLACYQARDLSSYSYWQDRAGLSSSILCIAGQVSEARIGLKSLNEKLTTETDEALRQRNLQFAFKDLAKGFPELDRSLEGTSAVWTIEPEDAVK